MNWNSLKYWESDAYQTVKEKLHDLHRKGITVNPVHELLFSSLVTTPFETVRVAIIGQDPYPRPGDATGVAFSVPASVKNLPPTLVNIFKEYDSDLHYPEPKSGDLTPWCKQGVLLWNMYPSCEAWRPGSHHWEEWEPLTREIVECLDKERTVIFILLGRVAQGCDRFIKTSEVIKTSHPSPLGAEKGFFGSRIFTICNTMLVNWNKAPIDWRLPC